MNILIICSYYPPDSAISAVRPYMFAKYLTQAGNHVTVLRSGQFNSTPDDKYEKLQDVKIVSFLGERCDAELYDKGLYVCPEKKIQAAKNGFFWRIAKKAYHLLKEPVTTKTRIDIAKKYFSLQKDAIDSLQQGFDIVISTYSELENVFAGDYAAKHFNAKWIMDFRDSIVDHINSERYAWNAYAKRYLQYAINNADLCTAVSSGLAEELRSYSENAYIETVYNGYDEDETSFSGAECKKGLSICYTGQIYDLRLSALKHLVAAIKRDRKSVV